MRNQRGGIKLITLIGIVLVLIIILFAIIIYKNINEKKLDRPMTGGVSVIQDTNIIQENNIQEQPTITDTKMDDFSMKFLQLENNQKNMIYSPLSIKYALKMLQEGADGNTYSQIEKVIGNLNVPTYRSIDKKLSLANGIYIRDTFSQRVKQDFTNSLITKYNAEVKYDKFENATNVNNWIEDKTLGIIKNMLRDEIVQNPDSKMLLINALAIDMQWKSSFDFADTYGKDFYLENGQTMNATTMNKKTSSEDVSYYIGDNITALTMDLEKCEDTELEFIAIMPDSNLQEYVDTLTTDKINEVASKLTSASNTKYGVQIQIPKFKFNYDLKLKEDLQSMGITDAFVGRVADFSKMTGDKSLCVGEALHKADIDFSEKGIKAAAVTVFAMYESMIALDENKPQEIKIDKPFLFLIRDKNTKEIWFTGTVYEPNSWEEDKADYQENY